MSGVKLGDRLLVLGCSDPALIAALAGKTGLTGRACAADANAELTRRAAVAVEREGALLEAFSAPWHALPFAPDSFDVVVIRGVLAGLDANTRAATVREAQRILRGGGRCLVIDDAPRGGWGSLLNRAPAGSPYAPAAALEATAFRGVRTLAEREGLRFTEGMKPVSGRPDLS